MPVALVFVAVLGFAVLDRAGAIVLALDGPRSLPTVLTGALLATAGVLAWRLGTDEGPGSSRRSQWRIGAVVLVVLGLERIVSLQDWVHEWEDASFAVVSGPVILLALVGWGLVAARLLGRAASLALLAAGAALWLGAQLPEALDRSSLEPAAAAGELAASGLLVAALLLAGPAERLTWTEDRRGLDAATALARRLVRHADVRRLAIATAATITAFAALGGLLFVLDLRHDPATEGSVALADHPLQWFDPNQELTFNTYFSALLPAAAACLALLLRSLRAAGKRTVWLGLALVFAAISAEELIDIHGKSQGVTGIAAQVTFAPVVAAALVVGLLALKGLSPHGPARKLFVAGALAWAVALGMDLLAGRESPIGILEEALEMSGSALFAFALLSEAKARLAAEAAGPPHRLAAE